VTLHTYTTIYNAGDKTVSRDITYIYNYLQCWWQNRA